MSTKSQKCTKIENRDFFARPADAVAKDLLGKILCCRAVDGSVVRRRITETEAYSGDEAFCYGFGGKNPRRKSAVFYSVGRVCFYYGMLMIGCSGESEPDNVLIRSLDGCRGPIICARALGVTAALNGAELTVSEDIWLEDDGERPDWKASKRVRIPDAAARNFTATEHI